MIAALLTLAGRIAFALSLAMFGAIAVAAGVCTAIAFGG